MQIRKTNREKGFYKENGYVYVGPIKLFKDVLLFNTDKSTNILMEMSQSDWPSGHGCLWPLCAWVHTKYLVQPKLLLLFLKERFRFLKQNVRIVLWNKSKSLVALRTLPMSNKTSTPCYKNPELKLKQRYIFSSIRVVCNYVFFFNLQTFGIPQGVFRYV